MTDLRMVRTKTTPRRKRSEGKKTYILKRRLANPKSVRFRNTQFTVRYERIGKSIRIIRNKK